MEKQQQKSLNEGIPHNSDIAKSMGHILFRHRYKRISFPKRIS